ncbi:MAG: hypothetical protein JRE28_13150 [Deltaproteobacteria bacterium]|nr:hypothetical protein [Deltaproteobacteria bacterium]
MKLKISIFILIATLFSGISASGAEEHVLKIFGCVKKPMSLTLKDLEKFQQSETQLNDIRKNGAFKGVFSCRGVSLKTLLRFAGIEKTDTDFKKSVDLAVVVKNRSNDQVVLSWGEIFYKNQDHVLIAIQAYPIYPHKGIDHFKDKAAYETMISTLNRRIRFPMLVISGDLFSDRCIESISEITVVDLKPEVEGEKSPAVYSENFKLVGPGISPVVIDKLPETSRKTIRAHVVGEGRGYHGTHDFTGIPLISLLGNIKLGFDTNTVFMVSAPDAYRSLISYGELFLNANGDRILFADQVDGKTWENGGRFILVLPDDLMADREVKAVSKIEIMHIGK